ncbi:MAG: ABC transporter ATP-binding protein [Promethearchaeota archaeon]
MSKHYQMGDVVVKALDEVSLEIKDGELLTLLGPSGAGKTTLLNVLGGIASPTSGKISVFGESIEGKTPPQLAEYRRKKIGFIFQFFNLLPTLNALENVEIALEMLGSKKEVREVAKNYLIAVGLEDRFHHFPSQLSGGQQQRVTIARALAKREFTGGGKFLVLCDEPTGNLDEQTGDTILELIRKMNAEYGATFVVVTHNPALTGKLGAKEIHIRDGHIVSLDA